MKNQAEKFFLRIEKFIFTNSNPEIITRILSELNLDRLITTNKEFNDFITKISTKEIDLSQLISKVKSSILDNEPLCTLLAFIQENDLISDSEISKASETLQLQINMLCIFEAMTITMANGENFAQDVYNHLLKRRGSYSPGNPLVNFFFGSPLNTPLFERLKMISIDPGVISILFHKSTGEREENRADLDEFVAKNKLSGWNADIDLAALHESSTNTVPGMGVNILEAAWEDSTGHAKNIGGINNAKAGIGLISIMEEKQYVTHFELTSNILPEGITSNAASIYELLPDLKIDSTRKKISQFNVDRQWRDLYSSWNLFFVISNIDNVLMPLKLLIPTVFSAEPQNYKEVRLLSLFLFGSLFLGEKTKNNPLFYSHYEFNNSTIILSKWGEINKKYASKQLQTLCPGSSKEVDSVYSHLFGNYPNVNFAAHLLSFGYNSRQYNFTQNYTTPKSSKSSYVFFSTAPEASGKRGPEVGSQKTL